MIDPKIIIFGNSGSGKSTLAKKLSRKHNVSHLDLDMLAWQTTDPPTRRSLNESAHTIDQFISENKGWVIEGCYVDLLQMVEGEANQAIFMNLSIKRCQDNARNRPWEPHKYVSKAAQDANLDMLLDWIADYENRDDEFSYRAHRTLYNQFAKNKQEITRNPS